MKVLVLNTSDDYKKLSGIDTSAQMIEGEKILTSFTILLYKSVLLFYKKMQV